MLRAVDTSIKECFINHTMEFSKKKKHHKRLCNNEYNNTEPQYHMKVYEFIREHGGIDEWTFDVLERAKLASKQEALELERYYYDIHQPSLNGKKVAVYGEEQRENREAYQKQYKQCGKMKILCSCGSTVCRNGIYAHRKTAKHIKNEAALTANRN
jgi:hypothetical protein